MNCLIQDFAENLYRFVALNGILVWLTLLGLISAQGSGDDGPEDLFEDDGKDIDMAFPEGILLKALNCC